ncbi:MAG: pyruvate formate lyase-activating protein, partial [Nitrososphaeria archaeon]
MERVTRNILRAAASGDVIIRHLDCCTKPALEWMARNLPRDRVLVNAMGQYRPDHLVLRRPG